jgi:hypothetical protein
MGEEIIFQDITGEPVSGRFEVSEGLITVTLPDGRKTTADIEESMLSPEILARVLLLQMHRAKQPNATSEDLLEDYRAEMKPGERPPAPPPNDGPGPLMAHWGATPCIKIVRTEG